MKKKKEIKCLLKCSEMEMKKISVKYPEVYDRSFSASPQLIDHINMLIIAERIKTLKEVLD